MQPDSIIIQDLVLERYVAKKTKRFRLCWGCRWDYVRKKTQLVPHMIKYEEAKPYEHVGVFLERCCCSGSKKRDRRLCLYRWHHPSTIPYIRNPAVFSTASHFLLTHLSVKRLAWNFTETAWCNSQVSILPRAQIYGRLLSVAGHAQLQTACHV